MPSQLSIDEVARVAHLARLELTPDEQSRLTAHLNDILLQFARLQELSTDDIEPTSHPLRLSNVMRDDVVTPCLPRDAATQNAPEKRDGNFIVPQIVEG
jgi:aspartyl-tRNA(Asn)/glutamyl-tRNA(Gln) amidotransferase subunit C